MTLLPEELPKLDNFIPTKADMEHCPLCKNKFVSYEEPGKQGNAMMVCLICMVKIWVRDPALGRWSRVEPEPCPFCKEPMRIFFRSDGYIKTQCPKCKFAAETVDPEKHQKLIDAEEARGVRFTPKHTVRCRACNKTVPTVNDLGLCSTCDYEREAEK